ncbi:class I adenylate-forming enzyme family protein [Haladaptatus caseinilyticus]|uniref:class I adenylate-forming enzyme family protein n=1 Tax=Haladaptatus caseinilyticus TaxID=2993314 RepID=UPI00224A4B01|nr:class I adenylate-forming enzyme family protein [Haladaptatus caseinilyticus]
MNFSNFVDLAANNVPIKPALGDTEDLLTHSALKSKTNAMANALETLGVSPGERIAIHLQNRVEFLIAHIGAMKRGAIPVPVNTHFTTDQISYVLSTSDISVLITDGQHPTISSNVETTITVDSNSNTSFYTLLEDESTDYSVHPRRNEEIAEILYTSGTTGRPKGVRHTHGNLQANATGIINYLGLSRNDVGLTVCHCFHVVGLNVTTTPLIVAQAENRLLPHWDPKLMLETIEKHGVTYAFFTPSMIIDLLECQDTDHYDLTSLQTVGVGGAPMPKDRLDDAEALLGCPVLEGYGMTETTPLAAFNRPDPMLRKPGSVGPPAREVVDIRIEDPQTGEAVDTGERGELLWRGDTVTPGYEQQQNDSDAFVERDGHQWLRSGDIGWLDAEDHLFIVDRLEDMFTTGCADVYPREIEDTLYEIDQITGAAVIDTRDDLRGAVVTAVITQSSDDLTADQILRICDNRLASHEVPQRIEFVNEIPTTATGKVDRVALRERFGTPSP